MVNALLMSVITLTTPIYTPDTIPDEVGSYHVEYQIIDDYGNEVDVIKLVTIVDEYSNTKDGEMITARDFYFTSEEDNIIERSHVQAWTIETNDKVEVEIEDITETNLGVSVTFTTSKGLTINVDGYITDRNELYEEIIDNNPTHYKSAQELNIWDFEVSKYFVISAVLTILMLLNLTRKIRNEIKLVESIGERIE